MNNEDDFVLHVEQVDGPELTIFGCPMAQHRSSAEAARGLVWLRDRLGHSGVAVTERYLRNVLNADTGGM